jgi:predicted phage-related endonuclease
LGGAPIIRPIRGRALTTCCDNNQASKGIDMPVTKIEQPVALDATARRALRELRKLRAERDEIDLKIKDRERKIKEAMGTHEVATVGGLPVATWKTSIRQSASMTLLKKAYPEAVAECTVQTEVRTFKLLGDD